MKTEEIKIKHKGKELSGNVALPTSIHEANLLFKASELLEFIQFALRQRSIALLKNGGKKRKKVVYLDLSALSRDDMELALELEKKAKNSHVPLPPLPEVSSNHPLVE